MNIKDCFIILFVSIVLFSCNSSNKKADAYGNFEAVETIISAEVTGKLLELGLSEGDNLEVGQTVGLIDTVQLYFQKKQLLSKKNVIESNFSNIIAQVAVIDEQISSYENEKKRIESLVKSGAATGKQLDDLKAQLNISNKQKASVKSQNSALFSETDVIQQSIAQIDDMIDRAVIKNPMQGTVLEKYSNQYEIVAAGMPLYKIANLEALVLRAYVSGTQLSEIKIGQNVEVHIDESKNKNYSYQGKIIWIASEAEFTPKIIQTKEERVNLVYAIKVKVKNDGKIKIGMPGEVYFKIS